MPRARKPCPIPGCPELVANGRCPTHASQARRLRGRQDYGARWRKRRVAYLRRHPVCVLCGAPSQVPDHYPTSRRDLIAHGVTDPDADHHLRPLCTICHNRETARYQPGGWHAERPAAETTGR